LARKKQTALSGVEQITEILQNGSNYPFPAGAAPFGFQGLHRRASDVIPSPPIPETNPPIPGVRILLGQRNWNNFPIYFSMEILILFEWIIFHIKSNLKNRSNFPILYLP